MAPLTWSAKSGSGDARRVDIDAVWVAYRRWVATILLAHKPRWADVEDLLQEVACALVRRPPDSADDLAVKQWLRTVAINAARAAARGAWGQRVVREGDVGGGVGEAGEASGRGLLEDVDGASEQEREMAARAERRTRAQQVVVLCEQLEDGYREPLLLKTVHGMSYREIGRVMNLPETTIETRIARARKQLRKLAESQGITARV
jgi:RNA polymerase sigma-70 factor, ECF subfamily